MENKFRLDIDQSKMKRNTTRTCQDFMNLVAQSKRKQFSEKIWSGYSMRWKVLGI